MLIGKKVRSSLIVVPFMWNSSLNYKETEGVVISKHCSTYPEVFMEIFAFVWHRGCIQSTSLNLAPVNPSKRLSPGCDNLVRMWSQPGDNLVTTLSMD